MKILIINPNSDTKMTKAIEDMACNFVNGDYQVECISTPGSPPFIETYRDQKVAAPGMLKLVKEHHQSVDAFIVACHCDPNLDLMKEVCLKPVVGIGEASMKIASMLGHRFSVISATSHSIPNKEALIQRYNLQNYLASIRAPQIQTDGPRSRETYLGLAQLAIEEDQAEVIVLGCAGMAGLDKYLQKELGLPVLDGIACALIITAGLVKYGVSVSKKRRYNNNWQD